jgi:ABC-2 type transport system permease protein
VGGQDNGERRFILIPVQPAYYEQNKEMFRNKIEEGTSQVLLIIPEDITSAAQITFISKSVSDLDLIQITRRRINDVVNKIRLQRAGFDPQKIKDLTSRIEIKTVKVVKGTETEKGIEQEFLTSFIFLLILYMTIIFYGAAVMRGVLEEKTSKIVEVLLSSGNSFQLMMGKIFGIGSAGLVQYGLWTAMALSTFFIISASSPAIAKNISISPLVFVFFVVFFLLGFFQFSTLYAAVGSMCSSQEDSQALSMPVTILIIIPFVVSFTVITDPTSQLARTLSLLPFFAPMLMFLRIVLVTPPAIEIILAIFINLVSIIFFTWISSKIYRVGILMYGKRPNLPELFRWLRYK